MPLLTPYFDSDSARVLALLEAKQLPMHAASYAMAAQQLVIDCQGLSSAQLALSGHQSPPGAEVLAENEYFNRYGRLLFGGTSASTAAACEWARLRLRLCPQSPCDTPPEWISALPQRE